VVYHIFLKDAQVPDDQLVLKVLVRMTAGGKRMYVVLTSDGIAARGETPVLPVYGDE
jgi:hypothetical protein